jgi:hypothetical protein
MLTFMLVVLFFVAAGVVTARFCAFNDTPPREWPRTQLKDRADTLAKRPVALPRKRPLLRDVQQERRT